MIYRLTLVVLVACGVLNAIPGMAQSVENDFYNAADVYESFLDEIVARDVDNDGLVDVVLISNGEGLAIRFGIGGGKLSDSVQIALLQPRTLDLRVRDLNGDGILDFVLLGSDLALRKTAIDVLLSSGERQWIATQTLTFGKLVKVSYELADADGDNRPDLLVRNGSLMRTYKGQADGSFVAGKKTPVRPGSIAVADFNGDAIVDLAITEQSQLPKYTALYFGKGNGAFRRGPLFNARKTAESLFADVDGDGDLDYIRRLKAVRGDIEVRVRLNNGSGRFASEYVAVESTLYDESDDQAGDRVHVENIAEDSRAEIFVLTKNIPGQTRFHSVDVFRPFVERNYIFAAGLFVSASGSSRTRFLVFDLNGDGVEDILYGDSGVSRLQVVPGRADGGFGPIVVVTVGGSYSPTEANMVLADLNGDGKPDIVVRGVGSAAGRLFVLLSK